MGDPKKPRKRYARPSHPWQRERIAQEKEYVRKYGLKNKKEVWKARYLLKKFRGQARSLQARRRAGDPQAERETEWLLSRLYRLGLLESGAHLDDVLALDVDDILARRFQTLVYQKGLAHTPKQARQFIVHGHCRLGGRRVNVPGILVTRELETTIDFDTGSPIAAPDHPMRPERAVVTEGVASPVGTKISLKTPGGDAETAPEAGEKDRGGE